MGSTPSTALETRHVFRRAFVRVFFMFPAALSSHVSLVVIQGSKAVGPFLLNLKGYPVQRTSQFEWELQGKDTTVLDCQGAFDGRFLHVSFTFLTRIWTAKGSRHRAASCCWVTDTATSGALFVTVSSRFGFTFLLHIIADGCCLMTSASTAMSSQ